MVYSESYAHLCSTHTHMTIETETMTTTASGKASEDKTKSLPKTTIRTTEQVVYVCVCAYDPSTL